MFSFLFGSNSEGKKPELKVEFTPPKINEKYRLPYFFPGSAIFCQGDYIKGKIFPSVDVSFTTIEANLLGQIRVKSDDHLDLFYKVHFNLNHKGKIKANEFKEFQFEPSNVTVPSYYGTHYDVRYIVQILLINNEKVVMTADAPIYFLICEPPPEQIIPLKSEIGIQELLHIELVIQNPIFDVSNCLIGKIYFLKVRMRIVEMFLQIHRVEIFENGVSSSKFTSLVANFELMDGSPVRGSEIPFRIHLSGVKLWPYPKESKNNLQVTYRIRFLLIDEEGKKYYKDITKNISRLCVGSDEPKTIETNVETTKEN